jgi:hypothetical protein
VTATRVQRPEHPRDVRRINERAFGQPLEADRLVEAVRCAAREGI